MGEKKERIKMKTKFKKGVVKVLFVTILLGTGAVTAQAASWSSWQFLNSNGFRGEMRTMVQADAGGQNRSEVFGIDGRGIAVARNRTSSSEITAARVQTTARANILSTTGGNGATGRLTHP